MSSSDSCMNGNSKGFNDNATSSDGYGGFAHYVYDAIVAFKKYPERFPAFLNMDDNRNAHFHWRTRCKQFSVTASGILIYTGNDDSPTTARSVVRLGETRHAIRFIHEKIGHAGQKQTMNMCVRRLYWRSMRRDVSRYVAECDMCRKRKHARRGDFQLTDSSFPSPRPADDDARMAATVERLLLNQPEDVPIVLQSEPDYDIYEEDEEQQYLEEGLDGGTEEEEVLMDENGLERDVATTLSSMNATYFMQMKDRRSTSVDVYDEEDPRTGMPMIVSDDLIPAASNEIVRTMISPSLLESLPSPSEEDEGELRMQRQAMDRRQQGNSVQRRSGGEGERKRRLINIPTMGGANVTKKGLMEENQALRGRVRMLEALNAEHNAVNMAMQLPPADEEAARLQKNVLMVQREAAMMQRAYWQSKLQRAGFDLVADYYDEGTPAETGEMGVGGGEGVQMQQHLYKVEDGEEEELEEHRIIEDASLGSVY